MAAVDAPPPRRENALPSTFDGPRRRRRPQPSPPRQVYAVVVRSGDAAEGVDAPLCGRLCKITRVPIRRARPSSSGEEASDPPFLCVYEDTDDTRVDISLRTESEPDVENEQKDLCLEEILAHFPNSHSIVAQPNKTGCSVDGRDAPTEECVSFLRRCIANWRSRQYPNRSRGRNERVLDVSRGDVEQMYRSLAQVASGHHAYRRHCTCSNECCVADAIVEVLEMDDDVGSLPGNASPLPRALQNGRDRANLRLLIAEGNGEGSGDSLGNEPVSSTSSQGGGFILPLPTARRVPLLSITLHPRGGDTAAGSDIDSDALLRACVKRLLVGRVVLHSDRTRAKNEGGEQSTLSIRCRLSVKVPQSESPGEGLWRVLEFGVGDVQSSGSQTSFDDRDEALSTLFVILPSTRIIFQCNEKAGSGKAGQSTNSTAPDVPLIGQIPSLPSSKGHHARVPPHQHLVESLRAMLCFQSDRGRPTVPRSFLLSGPPGVGKTYSVKQAVDIANSWPLDETASNAERKAVHLLSLRGSELLATASSSGGNHASSARELERQFRSAIGANAEAVIVFLDECDALVSSPVVAAMLAVILDRMEGVVDPEEGRGGWERILVVAATNRVDAIPAFLRRPGRLEKEVVVSPPDSEERFGLLKSLIGPSNCIDEADLHKVAEACVGYVAADLSALVRRAAILCIERQFHDPLRRPELQNHPPTMTAKDLFSAMNDVGASCLRDASLSAPPKTNWDDIAGDAGGAKRALREAIEWPRTRRRAFQALGLTPPRGVLLHGPPGCAKTTLARAAAGAAGVAFLSLSPADVYASSYVGEAEGVVRRAFDLARAAAPCVLFFDEIDACIGGDNGSGGHGMGRGASAEARVLSTFLNEMDGVDGSVDDGVLVLAATNRPFLLDAAILRPGRFDRVIYVPPPDEVGRKAILSMECKKWHTALSVYFRDKANSYPMDAEDHGSDGFEAYFDVDMLASEVVSGSMTGAEIVGACREAAVEVMQTLLGDQARADTTLCKQRAENLLRSLMEVLESTLRSKTPLLSNAPVLEEYTRFEREHR